jgi:hypothetical protein
MADFTMVNSKIVRGAEAYSTITLRPNPPELGTATSVVFLV